MTGAESIAAERARQQSVEGFTNDRDDQYRRNQLSRAAICYLMNSFFHPSPITLLLSMWPWDWEWWKPGSDRRNLVKAGALVAAEIDRLDRLENKS